MAEEAVDTTGRKRRVRAAHRGSVTRLTGQLEEALQSADVSRLKQLRQSLTDKSSVLSRLDDELIELVVEEQADQIKERISLAAINIDSALEDITMSTRKARRGTRGDPTRGDPPPRAEARSSK